MDAVRCPERTAYRALVEMRIERAEELQYAESYSGTSLDDVLSNQVLLYWEVPVPRNNTRCSITCLESVEEQRRHQSSERKAAIG